MDNVNVNRWTYKQLLTGNEDDADEDDDKDKKKDPLTIFEGQYHAGVMFLDNYCYTLSFEIKNKQQAGLRFYDVLKLVSGAKNTTSDSYLLQQSQVGLCRHIDYSQGASRLTYLLSYDQMNIVPILHRNTNIFIGMQERSEYLAAR